MKATALVGPTLRERRRRLLGLVAFAALFLVAGAGARAIATGPGGHVEMDPLFALGGYPLVSALLLLGWVLGRFPLIATLVLMAGLVSHDRTAGYARVYFVRPVSPLLVCGSRFLALAALAFVLSALLMPAYDFAMLGTWAGPATFVLILSYILAYGSLVALLSVWTRADAWIALLLGVAALVWDGLARADRLALPPGLREFITIVLPPQAALFRLESAFARVQPIPWDAFLFVAGYAVVMLALAGISLAHRET